MSSGRVNIPGDGSKHLDKWDEGLGLSKTPSRLDDEPPVWDDRLERLRAGYWQASKFLGQLAKDKGACFQPLSEDEAIDCLRSILGTVALILEQKCLRTEVSSLQLERTAAGVNVLFGKDSTVSFSDLIQTTATATDKLSPAAADIVSKVLMDELFADEICLPGFVRNRNSSPDMLVFDLLPEDTESQLVELERHGFKQGRVRK